MPTAEEKRLAEEAARRVNWKRWGPYLSERQWGTVREDYSATGDVWNAFPHDQARSRVYRWGEDGLLGFTDRQCRLCFCLGLWNGLDPILKERLYGVTPYESNHGEDVKECYYYLDATPTFSYCRALYKYPQRPFPYVQLIREGRKRGKLQPEFELEETGIFDDDKYFDVFAEYAKADAEDILIRITVANRGPTGKPIFLLPQLWFRNTWSWGVDDEGYDLPKPQIRKTGERQLTAEHATLGRFVLEAEKIEGARQALWFTDNETNHERLFHAREAGDRWYKDAFHRHLIDGEPRVLRPDGMGTKAAAYCMMNVPAGESRTLRLRLKRVDEAAMPGEAFADFDGVFEERKTECDAFYKATLPATLTADERLVSRQAHAGLLFTRQFYHYIVPRWHTGDPDQPAPPPERTWHLRNRNWKHLFNRDVISMPDKWEYPWYAMWDTAFHMLPMSRTDPAFAKDQLLLMLREWYMHPSGELPAYEFDFSDVNPPTHAWACWRVYKMTGRRKGGKKPGQPPQPRDRQFLARTFQKLLLNFTWWVNRKDAAGNSIFGGGFLGLDNIGLFDRSRPMPGVESLEQADGTGWMAFYCSQMLQMALELADGGVRGDNQRDLAYEDLASKFFEHFVQIVDAINTIGGTGLWDEHDGFYYDRIRLNGHELPLKVRSLVGLVPLFSAFTIDEDLLARLPDFRKRFEWFLEHRPEMARHVTASHCPDGTHRRLLAVPSPERLRRILAYLFDENEFLSPHGVRSLSKYHREHPFVLGLDGQDRAVRYVPGESETDLFGGNSNWRGPVWFPVNFLLVEALERYHHFYGPELKVEVPAGSGRMMSLHDAAGEIRRRLCTLFTADEQGRRPSCGENARYHANTHWKNLVLFHEYFHGDTGQGLGASHQTGWTALVTLLMEQQAADRPATAKRRSGTPT